MPVFFNRYFVLLWQGQLVSQLGNQAFLIAAAFYTLEATGSATLVAGAMIAATVPLVVLAPVAGAIADSHSRRSILVWTDLLRSAALGGLGLFLLWRPGATPRHVALIIAVAAFNGALGALFSPALQALIPDLVRAERLAAANSFSQMSRQTAALIGQALGGLLYAAWGPAGLLLFDAVSFAYAGAATWFLPRDLKPQRGTASIRRAIERYVTGTREGMVYLTGVAGMPAVLVIFAGVNCLFMPIFVLLPLYPRDVLGAGPEWYGFLLGGSGAGALLGSIVAGVVLTRTRAGAGLVRACVGGVACAAVVLGLSRSPWPALAAFIAVGVLSSLINVIVITAFQRAAPAALRGRIMGLVIAVSTAAAPLGMALGGLLGDLWRESLPFVVAGSGLAIAALVAISYRTRGFEAVINQSAPGAPPRASTSS